MESAFSRFRRDETRSETGLPPCGEKSLRDKADALLNCLSLDATMYCYRNPWEFDPSGGVPLFDVLWMCAKRSAKSHEEFHNDMLGGIVVLKHPGAISEKSASHGALYRPYSADAPKARQVKHRFVPYYAWENRAATPMQVWTPILKV
jgi:DUF1680 family protein